MPRRDYVEELEKLGYEVGRPMAGSLFVSGFGVQTYVRETDVEALDSLVDMRAHEERKTQQLETPEQTRRRHARKDGQ